MEKKYTDGKDKGWDFTHLDDPTLNFFTKYGEESQERYRNLELVRSILLLVEEAESLMLCFGAVSI